MCPIYVYGYTSLRCNLDSAIRGNTSPLNLMSHYSGVTCGLNSLCLDLFRFDSDAITVENVL